MKKKRILVIFIFLVLILGLVIFFNGLTNISNLIQNKPPENRTFYNEEYGAEFEYPYSWNLSGFTDKSSKSIFYISSPDFIAKKSGKSLTIVFTTNFTVYPYKTVEDTNCKNAYKGSQENCAEEYFQVDGVDAISRTYIQPQTKTSNIRDIRFIKDEKLYQFFTAYLPRNETIQELAKQRFIIDEIVSSFRFVSK